MTRVRVSTTIKGDAQATAKLQALASRVTDARPVWEPIVGDLLRDETARFDSRGFGRWAPLDRATSRHKAAAGLSPRTLEATGLLRRTLTRRNMPGQRLEVEALELRFGLKPTGPAYYGKFHQRGKGVPRRAVITMRPTQRRLINGRVRAYILSGATVPHRQR